MNLPSQNLETDELTAVEEYLTSGQQAMAQGDLEKAVKCFAQVTRHSPELPMGHFALGAALLSLNRTDEAVTRLREAVSLHPNQAIIHHQLGIALYLKKNYEAALEALQTAIALNPANTDILLSLVELFYESGYYADALECANRVLELSPHEADMARIKGLLVQKLNSLSLDRRQPQFNIIKKTQDLSSKKASPLDMINVEITTYCNLQCPGCFRTVINNNSKWQNSHMSVETFKQIMASLPPANIFMPYGIGEPTLNPHLPDIIRIAYESKKFNIISITTNALVRDLDYYANLFEVGLSRIMVSVDSLDPLLIDRLRRGTDVQKLKARIQQFVNHFPDRIDISTVVGRENIHAIPALLQELNQIGKLNVMLQPYDDLGNDSSCLSLAERTWFVHQIRKTTASFPHLNINVSHFVPSFDLCPKPWQGPYITVNGYVTPCCRITDPNICNFGNVTIDSFNQVWFAPKTKQWRERFLEESSPICQGCPVFIERKKPC